MHEICHLYLIYILFIWLLTSTTNWYLIRLCLPGVEVAKSHEESHEEEDHDIFSAETLSLPGREPLEGSESESVRASDEEVNPPTEPGESSAHGDKDLRSMYWKVVHEAQMKLKKAHPEKTGREILKMARDVFLD